jgi:hypothetical protein
VGLRSHQLKLRLGRLRVSFASDKVVVGVVRPRPSEKDRILLTVSANSSVHIYRLVNILGW